MRITPELLEGLYACNRGQAHFKCFLKDRKYVLLTKRNVLAALEANLDVQWFLEELGPKLKPYREAFLVSPKLGYCVARYIDLGPSEDTRNLAAQENMLAFSYAINVDNAAHPVTLKGVTKPHTIFWYGLYLGHHETLLDKMLVLHCVLLRRYVKSVLGTQHPKLHSLYGHLEWYKGLPPYSE